MALRGYDTWLNSGNPYDRAEHLTVCAHCDAEFEYEPEYDADEDGIYALSPPESCPDCLCEECEEGGKLVTVVEEGETRKLCSCCAEAC